MDIQTELFRLQDKKYRAFHCKLIPTVDPETVIGVRTPALRQLAKAIKGEEAERFLSVLPHQYYDENQLHAFLLSERKDFAECLDGVNAFLPYVNNWATCDQLIPKVFGKHRSKLLAPINVWLHSSETYTVRFAVKMLMEHFLDEDFDRSYLSMVAALRSEEYYINMMTAWYFATALAKQYQAALPFLEEKQLAAWTHNKAIQKAIESRRITPEQKAYLRTLKIPAGRARQQ
ncbi:DNA alkylation repair protein [Selenomonas ruminis]|uniref:DNA alkylation repair protein n=1 Tax=Selenomonas ruminis TaxID=2593411 RepID=A0A5D6W530_9FIRM|nr:DNA alkylation repair protein [Selenomonas sp. mPRGC5]TYZ22910.1 DNA alkylation repair protein [Selenomonas sp. mPRGC5]